jgi:hypothetical protein
MQSLVVLSKSGRYMAKVRFTFGASEKSHASAGASDGASDGAAEAGSDDSGAADVGAAELGVAVSSGFSLPHPAKSVQTRTSASTTYRSFFILFFPFSF